MSSGTKPVFSLLFQLRGDFYLQNYDCRIPAAELPDSNSAPAKLPQVISRAGSRLPPSAGRAQRIGGMRSSHAAGGAAAIAESRKAWFFAVREFAAQIPKPQKMRPNFSAQG
jgi:hypothetical protein